MKKLLKMFGIGSIVIAVVGSCAFLLYKNIKLNESYDSAITQVTQLQAKLDAVGTFADVFTVKTNVRMGQEIKEEDLVLQTIPTSAVPSNTITNKEDLIGNYYRIGLEPGTTLTSDFVNVEAYIGSVYERDVFLDTLPIGTVVGDYIDIRVVLPGGEEFVVFPHKRVNARFDNAVKMKYDESELWLYTSMMVDRALYKSFGFKIYASKYVDPGAHDKTVAYYPVRREVVDIMNINSNLTDIQRARMWNSDLRTSIDTKLAFYADTNNKDSSKIASGNSDEQSRYGQAEQYYEQVIKEISENKGGNGSGLVDPTNPNNSDNSSGNGSNDGNIGNLDPDGGGTSDAPNTDGQKDASGNGSVIESQDYLDNLGDNLFEDESPIE